MPHLRRLVLERLMRYYRYLSEVTAKKPIKTVTSAQIAEALDVDPTQVRKDLSAIGLVGLGRVGFDVCEICRAIRVALGFDQTFDAVLVGTGAARCWPIRALPQALPPMACMSWLRLTTTSAKSAAPSPA